MIVMIPNHWKGVCEASLPISCAVSVHLHADNVVCLIYVHMEDMKEKKKLLLKLFCKLDHFNPKFFKIVIFLEMLSVLEKHP